MTSVLPEIDGGAPLVEQITRFYADAIAGGSLRPGDRLPTIRAVAAHAGVNRATVQQAYRRLADSGLVTATVGRGTVVAEREPTPPGPVGRFALDAWEELQAAGDPPLPEGARVVADFSELRPDPASFPVGAFLDAIGDVLRERGEQLLAYGDPTGSAALRELLAQCPDTADAPTDPDEILITSGAQQGIDLVIRTLTTPGAAVAAAVPTYHQLFGTLKAHGLRFAPVRSTPDGPDLDDLRRVLAQPEVRLLYVMPTFHNPTGRTLDVARRQALLDVAVEAGVPVLEDEVECELRFAGDALPTLRSLDPRGWTATVRSFSKGLFPGLRVGWVHAGRALLGPLAAIKQFADLGTSPLVQASVLAFVQNGTLATHLGATRAELRARHAAAQAELRAAMPPGVTWSEPEGGFALWVDLPPGLSSERVARAAADRGVVVTPARVFDPTGRGPDGLRLSLSRVDVAAVREGIARLGACVRDASASRSKPPLYI